jgi:hypothetical protein
MVLYPELVVLHFNLVYFSVLIVLKQVALGLILVVPEDNAVFLKMGVQCVY